MECPLSRSPSQKLDTWVCHDHRADNCRLFSGISATQQRQRTCVGNLCGRIVSTSTGNAGLVAFSEMAMVQMDSPTAMEEIYLSAEVTKLMNARGLGRFYRVFLDRLGSVSRDDVEA